MDSKIKLPKLLNINQVAKILGVVPTTLRRWDKFGKLKVIRENIIKIMTELG